MIEIVDTDAHVRAFAASLDDIKGIGLITLEAVEIPGGDTVEGIAQ